MQKFPRHLNHFQYLEPIFYNLAQHVARVFLYCVLAATTIITRADNTTDQKHRN